MLCSCYAFAKSFLFFTTRGTFCGACEESIPMRLGKQAYVCRDCGLVCHKPCHVRVGEHCAQTSLPTMEL